MVFICPHDGHAVLSEEAPGPNCSRHGVPWFTHCLVCDTPWPLSARDHWMSDETEYRGQDFCAECAAPAPWLSRPRLLAWVRDQLQASAASGDVPRPATLELIEVLKRLDAMGADDTKTVAAWKRLREVAPKVWGATKPVRDVLIGETVKRLLGP
jgi:hypothetical protein